MTDPFLDLGALRPPEAGADMAAAATGSGASVGASGTTAAADIESSSLTLTPPAPVAVVATGQAADAVHLEPDQVRTLDAMVGSYIDAVADLDVHSQAFSARVQDLQNLGNEDIRAAAAVSNRFLTRPMAAMRTGGVAESSDVSRALLSLRRTVEELDPARQGDLLSPRKLLGILPFGDRLVSYFERYQSSQAHLNAVITSLHHGQDELRRDNAAIEQEKVNLWAIMGRLRQYTYLAQQLDSALAARITAIEASDADRARALREDLLFPVRQKVQDLLTQLAVSVQGYLALDLVRRNNVELSKGVDRATTTTVSALRTAVIVAQALADQKLVLDQITALNTTTGALIESTSQLLRQQSGQIGEQAASSTVELGRLQAAFTNIYATMDEIDAFKLKALDSLAQTVDALTTEVDRSQQYLARVGTQAASGDVDAKGGLLGLPAGTPGEPAGRGGAAG